MSSSSTARGRLSVAVALAAFNGERFLAAQLATLAAQTRLPDEIVIVDDASTDSTPEIIEAFRVRFADRVRVHRFEQNRGVTEAFSEAMGHCSSDVLMLCDQDDEWDSAKVARYAREFETNEMLGLLASDSRLIDEQGRELGETHWKRARVRPASVRRANSGDTFRVLIRHPFLAGHAMALRRKCLEGAFPTPGCWTYDEWLEVLVTARFPAQLLREPLTAHRLHRRQTVGAAKESLLDKVRAQRLAWEIAAIDRHVYRAEALRARLLQFDSDSVGLEVLELVERRLRFERSRRLMRESGTARRFVLIGRELAVGNYWRVGRGFLAVARDMTIRGVQGTGKQASRGSWESP